MFSSTAALVALHLVLTLVGLILTVHAGNSGRWTMGASIMAGIVCLVVPWLGSLAVIVAYAVTRSRARG
ncbi:hypothetical protein [Piscicoccus intestinalis]|uniref:hypothetical protein n=1 Tax=Piscicoccus intestinalis TaxID=746033 RepID=UPI000837F4ED|nr:hypothetical protein [Piscicoccus intestinalis]